MYWESRQAPLIAFLAVVLGIASCNSFEDRYFAFRLSESTAVPAESVQLIPVRRSEFEIPLYGFKIYDSVLVAWQAVKDFSLTACSLYSGNTLVHLCRRGRGGGETLTISPYYHIVDGVVELVENSRFRYFEINIPESIKKGQTIFDRTVILQTDNSPSTYNTILVGKDSLLCYDAKFNTISRKLAGIPGFSMYDLKDGSLIEEYGIARDASVKLKKKSPLSLGTLFRSDDCLVPESHCLGLAFYYFPAIAFLDYETGTIRGVKIEGVPEFNQMKRFLYFRGIEYAGGSIYLHYVGEPQNDDLSSEIHSKILKMDLSGRIEKSFELDDLYKSMEYGNGRLYLSKASDDYLYEIDLKKLN